MTIGWGQGHRAAQRPRKRGVGVPILSWSKRSEGRVKIGGTAHP